MQKKWPNLIFAQICSLIFYKKTDLGPIESHKPTELVQTLAVTHTHRMQKALPQMD